MVVLALWPLQDINGLKPVPIPALPSTFTLGRKVTCQLVITEAHAYVSGEHCRLRRLPDEDACAPGCLLEDLSANGTYVNSTRVGKDKSAKVGLGDEISMAKPTRAGGALKFKLQEAPPASSHPSSRLGHVPSASSTAQPADATPANISLGSRAVVDPALRQQAAPTLGAALRQNVTPALSAVKTATSTSNFACGAGGEALASSRATSGHDPFLRGPAPGRSGSFGGSGEALTPRSALVEALAEEGRRSQQEAASLQGRLSDARARAAELSAELRQEQARREMPSLQESEISSEAQACSRRLASECSELRDRLAKKHEDSARLEQELLPAAEKVVAEERQRSLRVREELSSARACMDRAEVQAQELRTNWLEAEAQAQSCSVQRELESAEARNAVLEEQCAETWVEIERAKASVSSSRAKLDTRANLLTTLKGAVKDHAQRLTERISTLDQALLDVPGGTSAVADSPCSARSRSPPPCGRANAGDLARFAACSSEPSAYPQPPLGNPEAPTIAYPSVLRETEAWAGSSRGEAVAAAAPEAKRRKSEVFEADGTAIAADRQRSSSSPSPTASPGAAALLAVAADG